MNTQKWNTSERYQVCSWLRNVVDDVENGNITNIGELDSRLRQLLDDIEQYLR